MNFYHKISRLNFFGYIRDTVNFLVCRWNLFFNNHELNRIKEIIKVSGEKLYTKYNKIVILIAMGFFK